MTSPLAGKRVLVTRERPGELGAMLEARGAIVVHVPLIEIREPDDGGGVLRRELAGCGTFDWLVVTSAAGAERVGACGSVTRRVSLAAVGTRHRTGAGRSGRPARRPDRPRSRRARHWPTSLDRALSRRRSRMFVAQADRAEPTLVDRFDRGRPRRHRVRRLPHGAAPTRCLDASPTPTRLVLASGSSVQAGPMRSGAGHRRWSWRSARPRRRWPRNSASRFLLLLPIIHSRDS